MKLAQRAKQKGQEKSSVTVQKAKKMTIIDENADIRPSKKIHSVQTPENKIKQSLLMEKSMHKRLISIRKENIQQKI
jgi:hypothetical protein